MSTPTPIVERLLATACTNAGLPATARTVRLISQPALAFEQKAARFLGRRP